MSDQSIQPEVIYKELTLWPGYRVSDDGFVWSLWKPHPGKGMVKGEVWRKLLGGTDKDGYKKVILCVAGVRRYARVHILILETFVGACPPGMESAHKDGNRANNAATNLEWKTHKNNIADKIAHGTHQEGEKHGMHKLTEEKVREIRRRHSEGESCSCLAKIFKVSNYAIYAAVKRRTWSYLDPVPASPPAVEQGTLFG